MDTPSQFISALPPFPAGIQQIHSTEEDVLAGLRRIRQLDGLTDQEYLWLIEHSREFSAKSGAQVFKDGDPAVHMILLLAGEIQVRRKFGGQGSLFVGRSGSLTGVLPFSRMKTSGGSGIVTEDIWALAIPRELFPEMLEAIPSMGQRCVSVLLDRVREMTRLEQQAEKLSALGKLAANLAHELNNPASAAQRAASNLLEELRTFGKVSFEAGKLCLTEEQETRYLQWKTELMSGIEHRSQKTSPLENGALEERLNRWLEQQQIPEAWSLAATLAESGIEPKQLAVLQEFFNPDAIKLALTHFVSSLRAERITAAVLESTGRIFGLIGAIQKYSHMDQAPLQDIDLAQSLENTLSMLHYRLTNVKVVREFNPRLPRIAANGSELNQVWMALIENALDAMQDKGQIRLLTQHAGDMVRVEIWDDGPGIPPEILSRIFEPFFTTRPAGKGPGLGLDAVQRILSRYRGTINVQSKPGATCFQVGIPMQQTGAY